VAKKEEILNSMKRNYKRTRESGEDRRAKKKQQRNKRRDSLLDLPIVEGQMETLCDRKKAQIADRK
jgi:hypothetical protein